jgi:hypothetical protein
MSYEFYRLIHFSGLFLLFSGIGAAVTSTFAATENTGIARKRSAILHGIGLLLALIGGFGMLARLQILWPWPEWVIGKIVIWLTIGGLMVPLKRLPKFRPLILGVAVVLGLIAARLAAQKAQIP